MTLYPTLAVLYFTTIFFSGDPPWVYSSSEIFILFYSLGLTVWLLLRSFFSCQFKFKIIKDPVTLLGLLFLAIVAFQLIPLPPRLLEIISPTSLEVWQKAPLPEGSWFPISIFPYATIQGIIFAFCLLLVCWWVSYGIQDRWHSEKLIFGIVVFGSLVAIYGLFETARGHDHILWWKKTIGQGTVTATFFNRNHLASFLSFNLLIGISYFWYLWNLSGESIPTGNIYHRTENRLKKLGPKGIIFVLALLILIFAILATTSRGGNLSTLAGIMLIVCVSLTRSPKKFSLSFIFIIFLILALAVFMSGDRIWERLKGEPLVTPSEIDGFSRSGMVEDTWSLYRDYPIMGAGYDCFRYIFTRYAEHSPKILDHAHNDWLELAAETGGVGFLVILFGVIFLAFRLLKRLKTSPDIFDSAITLGVLASLLSISLHALSDYSLHKPCNAFLLAILLGLSFRTVRIPNDCSSHETIINPKKKLVGPLLIILSVFLICIWAINSVVRSFICDLWIPAESDITRSPSVPDLEKAIAAIQHDPQSNLGWATASQVVLSKKKLIPENIFKKLIGYSRSAQQGKVLYLSPLEHQFLFFTMEALCRRPSEPQYWSRLSEGAESFLLKNPKFFAPLILEGYNNTIYFYPRFPKAYLKRGNFCLQFGQSLLGQNREVCYSDFRKSLELDPSLSHVIIKELLNSPHKLVNLDKILSLQKPPVWIYAGESLMENDQIEIGESLYQKGDQMKRLEAEKICEELRRYFPKNTQKIEFLKRKLVALDPENPWIFYVRGDTLKAMEQALLRDGSLQPLGDSNQLQRALMAFYPTNEGQKYKIQFYLALLDIEQNEIKEAARRLDLILEDRPYDFSALLTREQLIVKGIPNEKEKTFLNKIQSQIRLFTMHEIPSGAWVEMKETSNPQNRKCYLAKLRNSVPLTELSIWFPSDRYNFMIFLDDHFIGARRGTNKLFKFYPKTPLNPGEHQVYLKQILADVRRSPD
jgi:O-antigen ligase